MLGRGGWILILWVFFAALVGARVHQVFTRLYDPDEFEHLHAAYSIANGQVPYRDFFEHHGPLHYWMSAPLVGSSTEASPSLTLLRFVALAFAVLTTVGIGLLSRTLFPNVPVVFAILATWTLPSFAEKSLEGRPDGLATCAVTFAAWLLVRPKGSAGTTSFFTGVLLACAGLATQKVVFLALGLIVGAFVMRLRRRQSIGVWLLAGAMGVSLPVALAVLMLARQDALTDAYRCMVELPLTWPTRAGGNYLWGRTAWAPAHWGLLATALICLFKDRAWKGDLLVPLMALLCHALGALLTPATYFQFYMLAVPLAMTLAVGLVFNAGAFTQRLFLILGTVLVLFQAGMVVQRFGFPPIDPYGRLDVTSAAILGMALALALIVTVMRVRCTWIVGLLAILLFIPSVGRVLIPNFYWSNATQVADLQRVESLVRPDETVLDGFTGMAPCRSHADYWWWINEHTLPMMRASGADSTIRAAIAEGKPALVIFDAHLQELGGLEPVLARRYVPVDLGSPRPYSFLLRSDLSERGNNSRPHLHPGFSKP